MAKSLNCMNKDYMENTYLLLAFSHRFDAVTFPYTCTFKFRLNIIIPNRTSKLQSISFRAFCFPLLHKYSDFVNRATQIVTRMIVNWNKKSTWCLFMQVLCIHYLTLLIIIHIIKTCFAFKLTEVFVLHIFRF